MELKLGSIPVRVQGWFIVTALLLGADERDPVKLGVWVVIFLVSVLVHELGHATMGMAFGLASRIELHGMGGTTSFSAPAPDDEHRRPSVGTGKSVAISLAGPFAGFLLALVLVAAQLAGFRPTHPLARHALSLLISVNIGWGVFNLLPMLPLDGGNVLRSVLDAITKEHGEKVARVISIGVAVTIAFIAISRQQWWVLYLGVLFGFRNFQALRQAGRTELDRTLAVVIDRAYAAFERDAPSEAIALLRPALASRASTELRQVALRIYVASLLREEMWDDAMNVIERERGLMSPEELAHHARSMRELGRPREADRIDELGRALPPLGEFRA